MSAFKDAVQEDLNSVFLNLDEFAETHTVYYDGEEYPDVPLVLTGLSEKERVRQAISDHAQGLYRVSRVLHCDIAALGGKQPEKDCKLGILDSANIWLNGLVGAGYLLGARVEMLESENPLTSLMAGKIKLHIYMTPPSPAQEIDFVLEYDADYVTSALQS